MKADEPKPEAATPEPMPVAGTETPSDLAPQLIARVHELYEKLGREEVLAVLAWEKGKGETQKDEAKAAVNPVAAAAEPKRLALLPGGDHFFTGQLEFMQKALSGWLKEQLS